MSKIYLAGKIMKNCWRHDIVPNLCEASCVTSSRWYGIPNRRETINHLKYTELSSISKNLTITGPFFMSDDHGSYHNESSLHALGTDIEQPNYYNGDDYRTTLRSEHIKDICLHQISKSDYIFCWLDVKDSNPFGTIFELGFASSLNKQIILCFNSISAMQMYKDLLSIATHVFITDSPINGFRYLSSSLKDKFWSNLISNESVLEKLADDFILSLHNNLHVLPSLEQNNYQLNLSIHNFFDTISDIENLLEEHHKIEIIIQDDLDKDLINELLELLEAYPEQLILDTHSFLYSKNM